MAGYFQTRTFIENFKYFLLSNSTVVLFSRAPKVARAFKTAAHKNHPKNIVSKERHAHRIVLALPKLNIAFKTKY